MEREQILLFEQINTQVHIKLNASKLENTAVLKGIAAFLISTDFYVFADASTYYYKFSLLYAFDFVQPRIFYLFQNRTSLVSTSLS